MPVCPCPRAAQQTSRCTCLEASPARLRGRCKTYCFSFKTCPILLMPAFRPCHDALLESDVAHARPMSSSPSCPYLFVCSASFRPIFASLTKTLHASSRRTPALVATFFCLARYYFASMIFWDLVIHCFSSAFSSLHWLLLLLSPHIITSFSVFILPFIILHHASLSILVFFLYSFLRLSFIEIFRFSSYFVIFIKSLIYTLHSYIVFNFHICLHAIIFIIAYLFHISFSSFSIIPLSRPYFSLVWLFIQSREKVSIVSQVTGFCHSHIFFHALALPFLCLLRELSLSVIAFSLSVVHSSLSFLCHSHSSFSFSAS